VSALWRWNPNGYRTVVMFLASNRYPNSACWSENRREGASTVGVIFNPDMTIHYSMSNSCWRLGFHLGRSDMTMQSIWTQVVQSYRFYERGRVA